MKHIGFYIRDTVVPLTAGKMSIKDLAIKLGVSRPALSALLNGRADLSIEMAKKLEKKLGICGLELLKMQVEINYK